MQSKALKESGQLDLGWRIEEAKSGIDHSSKSYFLPCEKLSGGEAELLRWLINAYKTISREQELDCDRSRSAALQRLKSLLKHLCTSKNLLLPIEAADRIVSLASSHLIGYGPLDHLLNDDAIEEIAVLGINKPIYVCHRRTGWLKTNASLTSEEYAINLINRIARGLGRRLTYKSPRLNAILPDGSRIHASTPPLSGDVELTIRKFRKQPFTIAELVANGALSAELAAFLWLAVPADTSLLICGNTASGKTTLLNAIFAFVPENDRIIIAEETPEIAIPHKHIVRMVACEELAIKLSDIVADTLRMRPDRVIVGEVRTRNECTALIDAALAGQARGCYATMHANNANEARARLLALGARCEDLPALGLVAVLRRTAIATGSGFKEERRLTQLAEMSETGVNLLFDGKALNLRKSKTLKRLTANYRKSTATLIKQIEQRAKFLKKICNQHLNYEEFMKRVQKTWI